MDGVSEVGVERERSMSDREERYRVVRTIRRFEETVVELVNSDEIAGITHEYIGEEAVAAGVCAALRRDDAITSTHRGHGHAIAKGADLGRMFAELMGRVDGTNRGRGGSMHLADLSLNILGANGMVGAGAPLAAGAAWSFKQDGSGRIAVAFFGDGAINQGVVMETMNLASVWGLPILFVCENNGYAVTLSSGASTAGSVVERGSAFHLEARSVDGMDVDLVAADAEDLVGLVRKQSRPALLECRTYRFFGHQTAERTMGLRYREEEEVARWRLRDPVDIAGARLPNAVRAEVDARVEQELADGLAFGRSSMAPLPATAYDYVYAGAGQVREGVAWHD